MSRITKFKVWDKENKKWIDDIDIAINQKGDLFLRNEQQCEFYPISKTKSNNFEIVFSTGLKDKNGKEIYEGDIIRYSGDSPPQYCKLDDLFIVEWTLGKWVGTRIKDKMTLGYVGGNHLEDWLLSEDREIIGNKYQNKELL